MSIIRKTLGTIATTILIILGAAQVASAHDYEVEQGDTLSKIAADWEVPGGWQSVADWNSGAIDDPNLIYPGQVLEIREHKHMGDGRSGDSGSSSSGGSADPEPPESSGSKTRPATGPITSGYLGGYRSDGGHSGTDFDGTDGNAYAAADGTVAAGFWDGGYGNKLVIDHGDGVETWYAHLADFAVSAGDRVSAGQKVGDIGSTGNTTGPHLHFEVRIDGSMTDPMEWLSR